MEINGYILVSEYINNETKVLVKCKKCNNIFEVTPHQLKRKYTKGHCPFCEITTKNTTKEQAIYKLNQIEDIKEYKMISFDGFSPSTKGFELKHLKCGNIFRTNSDRFIKRHHRCPKCQHQSYAYTTDEIKKKLFNEVGNEYIMIGEYVNEKTKVNLVHNKCGHSWNVLIRNFLDKGTRCPKCKEIISKSSNIITKVLDSEDVVYEKEKTFNDLRGYGNRLLKFDFCIYFTDDTFILLEYDGEQHFNPRRTDTREIFHRRLQLDKIKNKYCLEKGYKLIRIPHTLKKDKLEILIKRMLKNNFNLSATTIERYNLYYNNEQNSIYNESYNLVE